MKEIGDSSLSNVTIFQKPKYAFFYKKGDKEYTTYEIWGVGRVLEYDHDYKTRKEGGGMYNSVSFCYRFLTYEYGCLVTLPDDEFVILNQYPSRETISNIINFVDCGSCIDLWTTTNACGEINNKKEVSNGK